MNLQATFRQNNVNELIATSQNEKGEIIVNGRDLHEFLEVKTEYKDWFPRMVEYGFIEGVDYIQFTEKVDAQKRARTYEQKNHAIKLDMAKQLGMLQRTEKGMQIREYFLKLESFWNSPEMVEQRYNEIRNKKIENLVQEKFLLENKLEEQKPKVLFAEAITSSRDSILIGDLANLLTQNGIKVGRNTLFKWLRENEYLQKNSNRPMQSALDKRLFEIHESSYFKKDRSTGISLTTKVTGHGQEYFLNKFLKFKI